MEGEGRGKRMDDIEEVVEVINKNIYINAHTHPHPQPCARPLEKNRGRRLIVDSRTKY